MDFSTLKHQKPPPVRGDFRQCLEFIDMMALFTDPEKLARQKAIEKRIKHPFNINGWTDQNRDAPPAEPHRPSSIEDGESP
jgi:hypothetical protein